MIRLLLLFILLVPCVSVAQTVQDDFSDGNFLDPLWLGDTLLFTQTSGRLQSNGPAATATLAISTVLPALGELEWRIELDYAFAPSTANYLRFYLLSDSQQVSGSLQGYFVQAGESGNDDSYDLFRQDGNSLTKLIDGVAGRAGDAVATTLRVRRSVTGSWTMETLSNSGIWQLEGSVLDNTYATGEYLGIFVRHSSTRNQSFFFDDLYVGSWDLDITPPSLQSAITSSENELILSFSEAIDSSSLVNPANYFVDQGIGSPFFAQWLGPSSVQLEFASPFLDQVPYFVTVSQIADVAGNVIPPGSGRSFSYQAPIQYQFGMLRIHEIFADPTPSQGLPEVEFIELLNRFSDTLDLTGWTISSRTTTGNIGAYRLPPGGLVSLLSNSDTAAFAAYPPIVGVASWPVLVNSGTTLSLRAPDGTLVDSVSYSTRFFSVSGKAAGGFSLEMINPEVLDCPTSVNWDGSTATIGGTPGSTNSLYDPAHDLRPAQIVQAQIIGPNLVQVCFSQPMSQQTLEDVSRYELLELGVPEEVEVLDPESRCVSLAFGGVIPDGRPLTLRVSMQTSCFGVALISDSAIVVKGVAAQPFQVLINEIMADETPVVGLPEAEFFEIYNATDQFLDISGGGVSDGGPTRHWDNVTLAPRAYAIVCDRRDSAAFAGYGQVIAVGGLPNLNNAGDDIFLYGANGELWDKVSYQLSWYRDPAKSSGGYTLEKINSSLSGCNLPGNWQASNSSTGGTPGQLNSVNGPFEDTESPRLVALRFLDEQTLVLTFSEEMGPSFEESARYTVLPDNVQPFSAAASDINRQEVVLLFGNAFPENTLLTLLVDQVSDCSGNLLTDSLLFGRPVPAAIGDILISEVLPNPFTGGSDFVEIYNVSSKVLDLAELQIGEIYPGTDSIFDTDPVSVEGRLFLPGQYLCLTRDVAFQQATYLPPAWANFHEMSGFPTYDDAAGEVVLFTNGGLVLERFAYEDDFHYPDLRSEDGVSLERISFKVPASQRDNWHSAASTVRFATPGYPNSQAESPGGREDQPVWLDPVTITPDGDGVDDLLAIRYDFSEQGMNARITIMDRSGRVVRVLRNQELLGTGEGSIFWNGRSDAGQRLPVGPYVVLVELSNQNTGKREVIRLVMVIAA